MRVLQLQRKPGRFHYSIEALFNKLREAMPKEAAIEVVTCPYASTGLRNRWYNLRFVRQQQADLFHITGDVHYLALGLPKKQTILTIHDLAFLDQKNLIKRFVLWLFWLYLPLRRVRTVTVISEATRQALLASISRSNLDIRVIPDCITHSFTSAPKAFHSQRLVVLLMGTKENKNQIRAVQALEGLSVNLLIIGKPNEVLKAQLAKSDLPYQWRQNLSELELEECYHQSDLLLFASTVEGFGLPILEAQTVGRPVVTSNLSSMPEVAGEAACLVDPYSVKSIREGVKRVINDEAYRTALIEKGFDNVQRFQPEVVAQQYLSLYKEIINT